MFASNELQINTSGVYEFEWRGTYENTTVITTQISVSTFLEQAAPGGSFVEVSGTRSYVFLRASTTTAHQGTANGSFILEGIGVGHKFRVRNDTTGSAFSAAQKNDGSIFKVKKIG